MARYFGPTKAQLEKELETMRNALADALSLVEQVLPYMWESDTEEFSDELDRLREVHAS